MTGSLNHDISNLILHIICPIILMQPRVIYSFSCSIYWEWNQLSQYHNTLPKNGTFTSLSQIEEYIRQCELWCLNLDNERVWSKAYLLAARMTNNPGVHEGHVRISQRQHFDLSPQMSHCWVVVLYLIGFEKSGVSMLSRTQIVMSCHL